MDDSKSAHYGTTRVTVNKRSAQTQSIKADHHHRIHEYFSHLYFSLEMNAITEESDRHDIELDDKEAVCFIIILINIIIIFGL